MINVAVIGVSGFGAVHYNDFVREHAAGRVNVVAATIINQAEEAEKCSFLKSIGCRLFTDYRAMLEEFRGKIDICFIPTGIAMHCPMTVAALESGANVYVEKPVAPTVEEAEIMKAAEKRTGRFVAVGYQTMYQPETRRIKELLLSGDEAGRLLDTLLLNMEPGRRIYRYNFLFDNCATRPRDKIERCISGQIAYNPSDTATTTFRELIHRHTRNHPWLTFGIDLALGAPLDRPITPREQMFLPSIYRSCAEEARIIESDGTVRLLTGETHTYAGAQGALDENAPTPFTPTVVFTLLFALVVVFSMWEYGRGRHIRAPDYVIFGLYGLFGCVLFFLIFISIHPATSPNYSALWCHPLLWVIALCEAFAPSKRITTQLMSLLLLVTLGTLVAMPFLPQKFNPAFIPLALIPAVRSIAWLKIEQKNGRL